MVFHMLAIPHHLEWFSERECLCIPLYIVQ